MPKKRPPIAPRKPGAAASAAQRFVEGGKEVDEYTSIPSGTRRYGREKLTRFTFYLEPALKKRLELWCLKNDKTGSEALTALVKKLLAGS
jgi:hypothetical protein